MNSSGHKIFIGYDSREDIAWQICRHSLERHSERVKVYPLRQPALRELGLYTRPYDETSSTEFSLTRFLTPYIAATDDWVVFSDCDFVFTRPLDELFASFSPEKAIYVVKHDYVPANSIKMDGKAQTTYPRKNWSSFVAFNGAHPSVRALVPDVVNSAPPSYLHRFEWVADEEIGELGLEWNFLVGEYAPSSETPAAIHYTNGGPWFSNWQNVDYADVWLREQDLYLETQSSNEVRPMTKEAR